MNNLFSTRELFELFKKPDELFINPNKRSKIYVLVAYFCMSIISLSLITLISKFFTEEVLSFELKFCFSMIPAYWWLKSQFNISLFNVLMKKNKDYLKNEVAAIIVLTAYFFLVCLLAVIIYFGLNMFVTKIL